MMCTVQVCVGLIIKNLFGLSVFFTQYLVFIAQYLNLVDLTTNCFVLDEFLVIVFMTQSLKKSDQVMENENRFHLFS